MRLVKENKAVLFLGGFLLGFLLMNMGKSILLTGTGMFDEDTLYHMRYMAVDSGALFCYILRKRFLRVSGLILLLTTYLGALTCAVMIAWYGLSAGVFLSTLLLRYGIRGFLLPWRAYFPNIFSMCLRYCCYCGGGTGNQQEPRRGGKERFSFYRYWGCF